MLRLWVDPTAPSSVVGDRPAPSGRLAGVDAYPTPCTAITERLP
jgi:hypothetical protein